MFNSIQFVIQNNKGIAIKKIIYTGLLAIIPPIIQMAYRGLVDSMIEFEIYRVTMYGIILVCLQITAPFFEHKNRIQDYKLNNNMFNDFSTSIIMKFQRIAYSQFENQETQNLIERMGESPQKQLAKEMIISVESLLLLLTLLGYGIIICKNAVFLWGLYLFLFFLIFWAKYKAETFFDIVVQKQTAEERREKYLANVLTNKNMLYEIKIYNAQVFFLDKLKKIIKKIYKERIKSNIQSEKYTSIANIYSITWMLIQIIYLLVSIKTEKVTVGDIIASLNSSIAAMAVVDSLSEKVSDLIRSGFSIKYYNHFMTLPEEKPLIIDSTDKTSFASTPYIQFIDVCFSYPGSEKPVLKNISFRIESHAHVAIVGENGAGKSTIIKLLCGLYLPTSGDILIDGKNTKCLTGKEISQLLGVVFQDYMKYELSIRENIGLGDISKIDDDNVLINALKIYHNETLMKLDLDKKVGRIYEDSVDLSEGEWQRLALCRGYISDAPFMLLDEPTAALDPNFENEIYNSFQEILKEKGCIIISNRLACTRICDYIIHLENGRVIETGQHEELMEKRGKYYIMYKTQSAWYGEE